MAPTKLRPSSRKDTPAEVSERVAWLLDKIWLGSQVRMAKETGISQGAISNVVRGKRPPGRSFLTAIARHPLVNIDWLLTGDGEPLLPSKGGELMLPIVRQILPGSPANFQNLWSGEYTPATEADFGETRYWFFVPSDDKPLGLHAGDLLLLETDRFWIEKPDMLLGGPCAVAGNDSAPQLQGLRYDPTTKPEGKFAIRLTPEGERRRHRRVQPAGTGGLKKPPAKSNAGTADGDRVPLRSIIAVGMLLQRRWNRPGAVP